MISFKSWVGGVKDMVGGRVVSDHAGPGMGERQVVTHFIVTAFRNVVSRLGQLSLLSLRGR